MVFESLKKMFKFSKESKQEQNSASYNRIDEEIDDFEREIQEYIKSTRHDDEPPTPEAPPTLSQGGAIVMSPEEKPDPPVEADPEKKPS